MKEIDLIRLAGQNKVYQMYVYCLKLSYNPKTMWEQLTALEWNEKFNKEYYSKDNGWWEIKWD